LEQDLQINKIALLRTSKFIIFPTKIIFVALQRKKIIKGADLILVMDRGDIIEKGTHKEFLQKKFFMLVYTIAN